MRQAGWGEIFAPRYQPTGAPPEVPAEPRGWRRLVWWEDVVTFVLLGFILLAVIASIDRAHWVDTMPSLYPIAFFGLFLGVLLARLRWREGYIHLLALPIGAAAALGQIMSILPGDTPLARYDALHDRMAAWVHIAVYGGISNDDLPFIVLVVPLVWLTSYLSAWAIFRWQNAWLALVPTGAVLLVNVSFLPSGFSLSFVVFLLGALLLATRLNLLERAKTWRAGDTPYPPLISLSVLHATFWLALVLLGLAWLMPQASQTGAFGSIWNKAQSPVNERMVKLSRLFVSVNNKKSYKVHDFGALLPFLGSIQLADTPVADITTASTVDVPAFLRAQAYDMYTAHGWQSDANQESPLGAYITDAERSLLERQSVHISVFSQSDSAGEALLTIGQPLDTNQRADARWNGSPQNVSGIVSPSALQQGDEYASTGSVSTATAAELRAAGNAYPSWVESHFLQLPGALPERVSALARQWTANEDSAYDKAATIESRLRSEYPYDLTVADTPPGRDTVDYFLFDLKRGYFDYHASAMVVMLRSLGIPSRLAVGYVLDPSSDGANDTFHITEANAFAWPEVYFPGYGWVEFNPTPSHGAVDRASGDTDAAAANPDSDANTINPQDLSGLPFIPPAGGPNGIAVQGTHSSSRTGWIIAAIAGGVALMLASGVAGARFAWVRGLSGLDSSARLWGQTVRLASWARTGPAPDQTPAEFARTLGGRLPGTEGSIDVLAESYVRHRYGKSRLAGAECEKLDRAWRRVRTSLLLRLLHLS